MDVALLSLAAPGAPGVLEVADQLLLLGVHTDDLQPRHREVLPLLGDVLNLGVAVGLFSPDLALLGVDMQHLVHPLAQTSDGLMADRVPELLQRPG